MILTLGKIETRKFTIPFSYSNRQLASKKSKISQLRQNLLYLNILSLTIQNKKNLFLTY